MVDDLDQNGGVGEEVYLRVEGTSERELLEGDGQLNNVEGFNEGMGSDPSVTLLIC